MKKFLVASLLLISGTVFAHGPHGYYQRYHGHDGWAPWVGGAIVGATLYNVYNRPATPAPIIYQPAPVVIQQPYVSNCTVWVETQNPDGTITRSRTCTQ